MLWLVHTEEENSGEELSDKALQSSSEHHNPPPPAVVDQQQQEGLHQQQQHQQQQLQPSEVEPSPSPKSGCRGKTSPNIRTRQLLYMNLSLCIFLHMIFLMFLKKKIHWILRGLGFFIFVDCLNFGKIFLLKNFFNLRIVKTHLSFKYA